MRYNKLINKNKKTVGFYSFVANFSQTLSALNKALYDKIMKQYILLIITLFSVFNVNAEYEFEKSKYSSGQVCNDLVGDWYADFTITMQGNVQARHIVQSRRNKDGTAYLKGLTFYSDTAEVQNYEFPTKWSCAGKWYVESNEWGYTAFELNKASNGLYVFIDSRNNLNTKIVTEFTESKELPNDFKNNLSIKQFFGVN